MALSNDLLSQLVKVNKEPKKASETTAYGTVVVSDGKTYVRLDGSELDTPVNTTSSVNDGDRVTVLIKNHTATITGNMSDPSASGTIVETQARKIAEFEDIVAHKITVEEIDAVRGMFEELEAKLIEVDKLEAVEAEIETLKAGLINADRLTATDLEAINAKIENLKATFGSFTDLSTENLEALNATIGRLQAYTGDFTYLSTEILEAVRAEIKELDVESLNSKYANIDFANIGEAAFKKIFSESGLIKDLVVGDSTITGELVGVTIKGDLIEGNTVKADKLVVKGSDGIYYKLNFDAGTFASGEAVPDDSLHGSIITAKSITAEKVSVKDLVAFGATIGGFNITSNSLYSGVKESVNNGTRGIYLDNDGQIAFGDGSNYVRFYKDANNKYKLEIAAERLTFGAKGTSLEDLQSDVIVDTTEQFYNSTSSTSLTGGSWSNTQPIWTEGKYVWRRTLVTYGDGSKYYTPSEAGVCITGNTGAAGKPGDKGDPGVSVVSVDVYYYLSSSSTSLSGGSWKTTAPAWENNKYMWSKTVTTYSDATTSESDPVCITGAKGTTGGAGATGLGVKSIVEEYYQSSSATALSGGTWSTTYPGWAEGKYIWTRSTITYTDNTTTTTSAVCVSGSKGSTGAAGVGIKLIQNKYAVSASNTTAPSTWYDTVQTMTTANKYLWNYEIVTFTDNTTSETAKRVIGAYGNTGGKGDTGNGISNITEYFLATSSGSGVKTSTSGWTTAIQTTTTTNKYLWNYEVVTYTNGSTYTSTPVIIGTHGATGADGQMLYASCSTAAATADKTATLASGSITLKSGVSVAVKFTYANNVASPTLNVNSTGAKAIRLNGEALTSSAYYWIANAVVTFIYDGTYWNIADASALTKANAALDAANNAQDSVDNLAIGARNLLLHTSGGEAVVINGGAVSTSGVTAWTNESRILTLNCSATGSTEIYYRFMNPGQSAENLYNLEPGVEYTLSGKAMVTTTSGTLTTFIVRTQSNPGAGWSGGTRSVITTVDRDEWLPFEAVFAVEDNAKGYYISVQLFYTNSWTGVIQLKELKLEQGNRATDWTPAPEDVDEGIGKAQGTADSAHDLAQALDSRIDILEDSITSIVRNKDGGTALKQDTSGMWYFDISDIENSISETGDQIEGLKIDINGKIDVINSTAEAIAARTEYVHSYTDENDKPCLELGEGDSKFKVKITNTEIQFLEGDAKPASLSNETLMIDKAKIKTDLGFGDFVWRKRDSGSMGIVWTGGENLLVNTHRFMAGTPIVMTSNKVDHHADVFNNYMMYTPLPVPAGSRVWVQACSDAIWAAEHTPSSASPQTVGLFVYWCRTLAEAMREDTETTNHYTQPYFFHGDNLTFGRCVGMVHVPSVSGSTTEWYARIRLNIYPNGTNEVTHKFWNVKMETAKEVDSTSVKQIDNDYYNANGDLVIKGDNGKFYEQAGVWTPHDSDESIW